MPTAAATSTMHATTAPVRTLDHAFAAVFHKIVAGANTALEWEQRNVAPEAGVIEGVTSLIPGVGGTAEDVEKLAFAALGALAVMVHANPAPKGGASSLSALATATGVSEDVLSGIAAYLALNPTVVTEAESLL